MDTTEKMSQIEKTLAKAKAIYSGTRLRDEKRHPGQSSDHAVGYVLAIILADLTSPDRNDRIRATKEVQELVKLAGEQK